MQISVQAETFSLAQVFTISRGSRTQAQVLTVRITQNGVVGWGECVPYARYGETIETVSTQIKSLGAIKRADLKAALPAGAARNAVDCALWDLEAKITGVRVSDIIGLDPLRPEITAYTLSLDTPVSMEAQARLNSFRPLLKIK